MSASDPGQPTDSKQRTRAFYDSEAATYADARYGESVETYPAEVVRLDHVLDILRRAGAKRVLDIGCGSGVPLLRMLEAGFDAFGFDFSPQMVQESRKLLTAHGQKAERVTEGDIEKLDTYPGAGFDAAVALGVFPHVIDEPGTLSNVRSVLKTGGLMVAEFRNALFSAFTLNRYSYDFYLDAFLRGPGILETGSDLGERAEEYFRNAFQIDATAMNTKTAGGSESDDVSYSELLAKFHNPLEISSTLEAAGLELSERVFYHFHVAPPEFERTHREEFWRLSMQMEQKFARDWRGYLMASAFLVVARSVR